MSSMQRARQLALHAAEAPVAESDVLVIHQALHEGWESVTLPGEPGRGPYQAFWDQSGCRSIVVRGWMFKAQNYNKPGYYGDQARSGAWISWLILSDPDPWGRVEGKPPNAKVMAYCRGIGKRRLYSKNNDPYTMPAPVQPVQIEETEIDADEMALLDAALSSAVSAAAPIQPVQPSPGRSGAGAPANATATSSAAPPTAPATAIVAAVAGSTSPSVSAIAAVAALSKSPKRGAIRDSRSLLPKSPTAAPAPPGKAAPFAGGFSIPPGQEMRVPPIQRVASGKQPPIAVGRTMPGPTRATAVVVLDDDEGPSAPLAGPSSGDSAAIGGTPPTAPADTVTLEVDWEEVPAHTPGGAGAAAAATQVRSSGGTAAAAGGAKSVGAGVGPARRAPVAAPAAEAMEIDDEADTIPVGSDGHLLAAPRARDPIEMVAAPPLGSLHGAMRGRLNFTVLANNGGNNKRPNGGAGDGGGQKAKKAKTGRVESETVKSARRDFMAGYEINPNEVKVLEELGRGAFSTVKRGEWDKQMVAVKMMNDQHADESFLKEAEILCKLDHYHIVRCFGVCASKHWVIMEYMPCSLHGILRVNGRLGNADALRIVRDIASGLAYLHSRTPRIVHRDIKPANVLLTTDWKCAKLADFGISRDQVSAETMTRIGTPHYMPPEMLAGTRYSEKVDIYSSGMVLWQTLTGTTPYAGMGPDGRNLEGLQIAIQVASADIDLRPNIPEDIDAGIAMLIRECWARDAEIRPSAAALVQRLTELLNTVR